MPPSLCAILVSPIFADIQEAARKGKETQQRITCFSARNDRIGPCPCYKPANPRIRTSVQPATMHRITIISCCATMSTDNDRQTTDYQALAEFRYQIRRFLHFSEETARKAGLEPQHHQLMLAVKGAAKRTEPRIAYLAERLQLQHHSVVELVDRLAKRGLIQRTRSQEDRREVHVKLTPRGERILKQLTLDHGVELRTAASALITTLKKVMATTQGSHKRHEEKRARAAATGGRSSR
jgi:DNA-binding MarR family transcriptional regulator